AGIGRMKAWKVALYSSVSIAIWNTLIVLLGYYAGRNKEKIFTWFETYQNIVSGLLIGILLLYIFRKIYLHYKNKSKKKKNAEKEVREKKKKKVDN
ncbi:MAG: hypothetical protein QW728_02415, partial [Thermoplasmata archaeon]